MISRDNGAGLSRDMSLMCETLVQAGIGAERVGFGTGDMRDLLRECRMWLSRGMVGKVGTQVFSERIYPRCLGLARRNLFMPNPEWFLPQWLPYLWQFDEVLCKTRHAERIFRQMGCRTRYVGFTSQDQFDSRVARQRAFFHLAGRSSAKGTRVLLDAWRRHPEWPLLTVVQHPRKARHVARAANIDHRVGYIDGAELKRLQNAHSFHICPSETEGFGHYLMEGMSAGAVMITTAADPMDELVAPSRGILIPPVSSRVRRLAAFHYVDVAGIEAAVEQALALDAEVLVRMSRQAREHFVYNDTAFRARFVDAIRDTERDGERVAAAQPVEVR